MKSWRWSSSSSKNGSNNGPPPPPGPGATTTPVSSLLLYGKKERNLKMTIITMGPFILSFIALTTIFTLFLLYSPDPFNKHQLQQQEQKQQQQEQQLQKRDDDPLFHPDHRTVLFRPPPPPNHNEEEKCDIFKGRWVPDHQGARYSNSSCKTIPDSKNCFKYGRQDKDFLNWRWKPDHCVLHKFDPKAFFHIVRGKTMAFVGDSVARNHVESLLCLLSKEEVPVEVYKDSEDRNRIWYFPNHEFVLKVLWTKFLIAGEERMVNGTTTNIHDLHLDRLDENWARDLHALDYVVISAAHWFFRAIYLYQDSKVVGCIYCSDPNVTNWDVNSAVKMALRAALNRINQCKECKSTVAVMRTFSPSHFENGLWNTGGTCNRTSPVREKDMDSGKEVYRLRDKQVEELRRIRGKAKKGKKFGVLDITKAMRMRPDGHPGEFWNNEWMKGYQDCVHWCLPGPIDVWNDFLLAILTRLG